MDDGEIVLTTLDVAKLSKSFKDKYKCKLAPIAIIYLFYERRHKFLRYVNMYKVKKG